MSGFCNFLCKRYNEIINLILYFPISLQPSTRQSSANVLDDLFDWVQPIIPAVTLEVPMFRKFGVWKKIKQSVLDIICQEKLGLL